MKQPMTREHQTYVSITEAERLTGKPRNAIRRAAIREGIPFYSHPMDARRTMLAITDLEKLTLPKVAQA